LIEPPLQWSVGISGCPIFFLPEPFTLPLKKKLGGLGLLQKSALLRGGFDLNFFGGELVEGKKMLFQPFKSSFNGWLVSKLEFYFLSLS
jgi:hypothetical protein